MKKFFTIISIGLIIYFTATHFYNKDSDNFLNKNSKAENNEDIGFIQRTFSNIMTDFLKTPEGQSVLLKMVQPINNDLTNSNHFSYEMNNKNIIDKNFNIVTNGEEKNSKALCGHMVDIEYKLQKSGEKEIISKSATLKLGDPSVTIGLSSLITGMSEGQKRTAMVPETLLFESHDANQAIIEVQLNKIISKKFIDNSKVKIFDNIISNQLPYLCGETVNIDIKISKFNGEVVYQSMKDEPIKYRIGDKKFPIILSYSLYNKPKVGMRTVIAPGKYLKDFNEGKSVLNLNLNNNEYYILEININNSKKNNIMS